MARAKRRDQTILERLPFQPPLPELGILPKMPVQPARIKHEQDEPGRGARLKGRETQ